MFLGKQRHSSYIEISMAVVVLIGFVDFGRKPNVSCRCLILLILSMIYAALQVTAWRSYQVIGWGDGVFELTTNGVFAFALRTEMPMMLRLSITIKEIDCDN